jgi:cytochrome c biogenesis protein CcmG, thiol:disulfide interchange protein DsbE
VDETSGPAASEDDESKPRRAQPLFRLLRLGALAAVAGLLALLIWRVVDERQGPKLVSAIKTGKNPPAPGFTLPVLWDHSETWPGDLVPALEDGEVSLAEVRGYPVVINFWASWCGPCKKEAPLLVASARAHAGKVAFLGIDIQDFKGNARRFLRRFDTNYVSVRDGNDTTYRSYGLTGVPETYYLDVRGRIVAHTAGQLSRSELEAGISKASEGR